MPRYTVDVTITLEADMDPEAVESMIGDKTWEALDDYDVSHVDVSAVEEVPNA